MAAGKRILTDNHLRGLKDHKYKAEGVSISEIVLQPFWRYVVELVPLWVAPNLLTFAGLVVNVITTLLVLLLDLRAEGKVRFLYVCIYLFEISILCIVYKLCLT